MKVKVFAVLHAKGSTEEQTREAIARINDLLNASLRNVFSSPPPSGVDVTDWREFQVIFLAMFLPIVEV